MWERNNAPVSQTLRGLFDFGEEGFDAAARIASRLETVDRRLILEIAKRVSVKATETGARTSDMAVLTALIKKSHSVQSIVVRHCEDEHSGLARIAFLECLWEAGGATLARDPAESIANDENAYQGDRIEAAALLTRMGQHGIAKSVLDVMVRDADEAFQCAEAAYQLWKIKPTRTTRDLLAEKFNDCWSEHETIPIHLLSGMLQAGEIELALPSLRELAKAGNPASEFHKSILRNEIEAAEIIAKHYDLEEGLALLRQLSQAESYNLRARTEAVAAIERIASRDEARTILESLLQGQDDQTELDWFGLELLQELGLADTAADIGFLKYEKLLSENAPEYEIKNILKFLRPIVKVEKLLSPLERALTVRRAAWLVSCLAILGKREEASSRLRRWIKHAPWPLRLEAAEALCEIGESAAGYRAITSALRDVSLPGNARLRAAKAALDVRGNAAGQSAYKALIDDTASSMDCRLSAANRLLQMGTVSDREWVWDTMFPAIYDTQLSASDKLRVAKLLLGSNEEDWAEYNHRDVCDELFSFLENEEGSPNELWKAVELLLKHGWTTEEIPCIGQLLDSNEISDSRKIRGLAESSKKIGKIEYDFVIRQTQSISASFDTIVTALEVLRKSGSHSDWQEQLETFIQTPGVPVSWSIVSAAGCGYQVGRPFSRERLLDICNNSYICISWRLKALESLKSVVEIPERAAIAREMALVAPMGSYEHFELAECLWSLGETDLALEIISNILTNEPVAITDRIAAAEYQITFGEIQRATTILRDIAFLPLALIEELEEPHLLIDAAHMLSEYGELPVAEKLLLKLAETADWSDFADVIQASFRISGIHTVEIMATKRMPDLLDDQLDGTMDSYGWAKAFEALLNCDQKIDLRILAARAEYTALEPEERVKAAAVLLRNNWRDPGGGWHSTALTVLKSVATAYVEPSWDLHLLIDLMRVADLDFESNKLLERMAAKSPMTDDQRVHLCTVLLSEGNVVSASAVAAEIVDVIGVSTNKWLGKELRNLLSDMDVPLSPPIQFSADSRVLIDQLFEARDAVRKVGDRRSLNKLFEVANTDTYEADARLHALEGLYDLGFRNAVLARLEDVVDAPGVDDYWAGELCFRVGMRQKGLEKLARAIETSEEACRTQIAHRLADLQKLELLKQLDSRWEVK